MEQSVTATVGDEPAGALPVSPVRIDIGELKGRPHSRGDRLRFLAIVTVCLALHVAIALMLEPREPAQVADFEEAIPVEIIVEPPAEDPLPAPAVETPPEPQAQTIDEKPATDFARSTDQDRVDGKGSEQAAAEAKEPDPTPPQTPAEETQPTLPPDPAPEALPEPKPPAKPSQNLAALTPVPSYEFQAPPAKRSDGPRGAADPGYLSTLYGRIMRKMPQMPKPPRPVHGRVTFAISGDGRIFRETIAIASGSPFLDAAALGAVRRAAPYPPPPKGGTVYIQFNYGSD